jgi:hypothetical protein
VSGSVLSFCSLNACSSAAVTSCLERAAKRQCSRVRSVSCRQAAIPPSRVDFSSQASATSTVLRNRLCELHEAAIAAKRSPRPHEPRMTAKPSLISATWRASPADLRLFEGALKPSLLARRWCTRTRKREYDIVCACQVHGPTGGHEFHLGH